MMPYKSWSGVRLDPVPGLLVNSRRTRAEDSCGERSPYGRMFAPDLDTTEDLQDVNAATPALSARNRRRFSRDSLFMISASDNLSCARENDAPKNVSGIVDGLAGFGSDFCAEAK